MTERPGPTREDSDVSSASRHPRGDWGSLPAHVARLVPEQVGGDAGRCADV
jgi:hypothetical protein